MSFMGYDVAGTHSYLIFFPAMVVLSLPALEFAVARTLTTSFFGFLVSLLPLFFSLDMG